jgi:Tfp pilus assembly protein PilO
MDSVKKIKKQVQELESKLEDLRNELDVKDNNPIESTRIKKEIGDLVKNISDLKDKLPVDKDKAKVYFDLMRKAINEKLTYRQFFDL